MAFVQASYNLSYILISSIWNFMVKIKKWKKKFGPQKDFFIKNLWKKLCSTQKVCLINVSSEYRKNAQGEKLEPPKRLNFMILGHRNFFPWQFFLYSDDTFIRHTFLVEKSFFHKFFMKKSFWGTKMYFSFFDFFNIISYGENDYVIQIIWQYFLQLHAICVPNI